MSDAEETSKSNLNLQSENPAMDDPLRTTSFLTIAYATTFITQCRDFLEKEKLESQDSDGSDASETMLNALTEQDISMIHEELFHSWNTIKNENIKVMPTITQPKSWPPRHDQVLEYEETLDSFEQAKSKMDLGTHSQMASRPLSPDLLDLLESQIRVVNDFTRLSKTSPMPYDKNVKSEAKVLESDKNPFKLVLKAQSSSNIPQDEKDQVPQETIPLLTTLKRSASLNLSIRIYEWSEGDLRRRVQLEEQKALTPSSSKSEDALASSLPSNVRLNKRREFSFWLLNQTRKLYDSIVSEQLGESDEASQNTSSSHTKDSSIPETSNKSPILLPPASEENQGSNSQRNLSLNVFSDDTLSEVTSILTDSDFLRGKASDQAKKMQTEGDPPTPSSSIDSTVSSLDSNPNRRRDRSPDDSVSTPKRQTV